MVIFSIVYDVMILEWDGSGVEEEYSAAMGLFGIPECLSLKDSLERARTSSNRSLLVEICVSFQPLHSSYPPPTTGIWITIPLYTTTCHPIFMDIEGL